MGLKIYYFNNINGTIRKVIMLRDYEYCVSGGYTAEDYAGTWGDDLFNELFSSAVECFWSDHLDVSEEYDGKLELSEAAESTCRELCYDAYKEAYERYEVERETLLTEFSGNFEDYEVDDVVTDIFNIVTGNMSDQLNKLLEDKEKE